MSILRTRNKNTNQWEEIQAIKGDTGPTGPRGETGATGPKGDKGDNYEITSADYQSIANIVEDDMSVVLSSKVDKVSGKGLSTNDFTNGYKADLNNNTAARHTHSNKTVLNGISASDITNWNNKVSDSNYVHTDNNYTTTEKNKLAGLSNYDDTEVKSSISNLQTNKADKSEIPDVRNFITKSDIGDGLKIDNSKIMTKLSTAYGNLLKLNSSGELYVSGNDIALDSYLLNLLPYQSSMRVGLNSGNASSGALASKTDLISKQDIEDNTLTTVNKTVPSAINEVNSIAKGANQALSYSNYSTMVTAFNSFDDDAYNVGQNVMIVTLEVPDLWISGIESTSVPYTYIDDETVINALQTNGYIQVGYYKLSMLETQKVDLTNYVTNTDYASASKGGVVKSGGGIMIRTTGNDVGTMYGYQYTFQNYISWVDGSTLISKGTLENVLAGKGLNNINQVPSSTAQDADKVLTVNSQGVAEWQTAHGGEIPAPTLLTRGGIYAQTVQDTSNMQEVVIGSNGKAYVNNDYSSLVHSILGNVPEEEESEE